MRPVDFQIFEALGSPVAVLEPGGKVVYWNHACSRLTGVTSDALRGRHAWELLAVPDEVASLKASFAQLLKDRQPVQIEHHGTTATGERRLIAWSCSAVGGSDEGIEWIVMAGIDITARASDREPAPSRGWFEHAPDGVFIADQDGRCTDVNETGRRLLGYSREEVIGKTIADLAPVEDAGCVQALRAGLPGGGTQTADCKLRRQDGTCVPVEVSARTLPDGRWECFVRDTSARTAGAAAHERLLAQSNADRRWLQAVLDTAPLGILLFEPDGRLSFNPRAEELMGMSLSPTGGRAQYASRILFPDGTPVPPERLVSTRVLTTGEIVVGEEYLIERPDGARVPVLGSAAPIRDGEGRIAGGVGVFQDISERMRAEEAIRENERLLDGIFDLLPVGVWIADETGRIVRTNPAGLRIWAGARYVGINQFGEYKAWWADTGKPIPPEDWALARALNKGETSIGELLRIQCFDGTFKTIINSALPLYDEHGAFAGAVAVNDDVTGLKEIEEALRRAVRAHEEVLGIVAHDLRNPLNTILLQLQLMSRAGKQSEPCDLKGLERIRASARRMNRLIQDLLDVVRIEGNTLSQERGALSVTSLLLDVVESQQKLVSDASMSLHLDVQAELPDIWADRDRLLQVLENLIGNAIKFAEPGVDIAVGAAPKGSEVLLWVADRGAGIPAEDLPHLFDRFWQARKTDKRGAGLGLAIVKGIVEAHGGRVWVESQLGVGTTFYFTIPVAARAGDGHELSANDATGADMRPR
jgi:PAS domain S-box-containing protein